MRLSAIAWLALFLGGCGAAAPTPPSGDLAGAYDFRLPPGSDLRPGAADLAAASDGGGWGR